MFAVVIISLSALFVAAAQKGTNDPVSRIAVLGVSPSGIPSKPRECRWDNQEIIIAYAQKSATASELMKFLAVPKNVKACTDALGTQFCLIAIEPTGVTKVIVKNGIVGKPEFSLPRAPIAWADDVHFLLKEK